MSENKLEKGEYVIGIALILAALLISATLFVSTGNIQKSIEKIVVSATGTQTGQAVQTGNDGNTQGAQGTNNGQVAPPTTAPSAPKLTGLDFSAAQTKGNPNGNIVMVEYSDFQCPYCGRVIPTIAQVIANYNNVKFIFRQFPLSFHENAQKAAEASLCAAQQNKFWELHDKMYADQNALSVSDIKGYAATLGLDTNAFNSCLDSGSMASEVAKENAEGAGMGIRGTPGFLVYAKTDKSAALAAKLDTVASSLRQLGADATVVDVDGAGKGIVFAGALPYANFQQVLGAFPQ